jgi:hypothetical protein
MFKFLHKAMGELIAGAGDIRQRVMYAGEHLLMIPLEVFPEYLRRDAQDLREYLTEWKADPGAPYPYDSDLRVTMRRRRASAAVKAAERIWTLYLMYERALDADE